MAEIKEATKQRDTKARGRHTPDLSGFIVRCEANYQLLLKLIPDIQLEDDIALGLAPLAKTFGYLNIVVTERCKYTTTVTITQSQLTPVEEGPRRPDKGCESKPWLQEPTMSVRLYHDARMAEVLSFQKLGRIKPSYDYPNKKMYQRNEKAQLNQFLGEWLQYCLQVGQVLEDPLASLDTSSGA